MNKRSGHTWIAMIIALILSVVLPISTQAVQAAPNVLPSLPSTPTLSKSEVVIDGEYIVLFKEGTPIETMNAVIKQYGGKKIDGSYDSNFVLIQLSDEQYMDIRPNQHIETVEKNQMASLQSSRSLYQYSHELTNVTKAWETNVKGNGVKIAILDSGVFNHRDLNLAGGVSTVNYTNSYDDDNGHGTHVAGIIASKNDGVGTTGVASGSKIYSVKVIDYKGISYLMDIIEGVDWSIQKDVDLINMSLGTLYPSTILKAKIDEAVSNGIIVVAATGNSGALQVEYPAGFDNVIGVGATDKYNRLASFSNRGSEVNVVAPGREIVSTYLGNQYAIADGTSQATPYVTGMLALYLEKYPQKNSQEIIQMLYDNALDLGTPGKDLLYGNGLVQYPSVEVEDPTKPQLFIDVRSNHWAYSGIKYLTDRNIIYGYGNGKFGPNDTITRLHSVLMILRAKGITSYSNVKNPQFIDVQPGDSGYNAIAKSVELGMIRGKENHLGQAYFDPKGNLTRAEMAVILSNAYQLKAKGKTTFHDVPSHHWAYSSIQALADHGISVGNGSGTYGPNDPITRAEFSVMMTRLLTHQ